MSMFKRARKILLRCLCEFGYSSDPELNALKQTLAKRRQKYAQLIAAQVQVKQEISRAGNDEAALAVMKEKLRSLERVRPVKDVVALAPGVWFP